MKISDLKLEPLLTTQPDESIADVAERMHFYEVGSLAVLDDGSLVGIVTERDVVGAVADHLNPDHFTVRFYMTSRPTTVSSDTEVGEAAELMLGLGVRHLPVTEAGRPIGMISIRDVLIAELQAERDVAIYG